MSSLPRPNIAAPAAHQCAAWGTCSFCAVCGKNLHSIVVTEYVAPPMPTTMYNWVAYIEGNEESCGRGPTEAEALRDLCEKLHDMLRMCYVP